LPARLSYDPLRKAAALAVSNLGGLPPKNGVQFMVKDQENTSDQRLGVANLTTATCASEAVQTPAFLPPGCQTRDFVFNRYSP
jgi:hypothetical protein